MRVKRGLEWGRAEFPIMCACVWVCVCSGPFDGCILECISAPSWETWVIGAENAGDLALQLEVLHSLVSFTTLVGLNNVIYMLRRPPSLCPTQGATSCGTISQYVAVLGTWRGVIKESFHLPRCLTCLLNAVWHFKNPTSCAATECTLSLKADELNILKVGDFIY